MKEEFWWEDARGTRSSLDVIYCFVKKTPLVFGQLEREGKDSEGRKQGGKERQGGKLPHAVYWDLHSGAQAVLLDAGPLITWKTSAIGDCSRGTAQVGAGFRRCVAVISMVVARGWGYGTRRVSTPPLQKQPRSNPQEPQIAEKGSVFSTESACAQ